MSTDGSIQTPDPGVVVSLDRRDVEVTVLALKRAIREADVSDFPEKAPVAAYRTALAKFETILADQDDEEERRRAEVFPGGEAPLGDEQAR